MKTAYRNRGFLKEPPVSSGGFLKELAPEIILSLIFKFSKRLRMMKPQK
jgi:hypothetical protein